MTRLLLLIPSTSYRVSDFVKAAHRLGVDVTVGSNERQVLESINKGGTVTIDFSNPDSAIIEIEEFHTSFPIIAIVGVDDTTAIIAAKASQKLGFKYSSPKAVMATGNKLLLRHALSTSDLSSTKYNTIGLNDDPRKFSRKIDFPCVLKPLNLAASQGVIRANTQKEFVTAFERIKNILLNIEKNSKKEILPTILVEDYIEGAEVALEGLMIDGKLSVLAIFDKPDPLEGPYFEETIYVTPSRKPAYTQESIKNMAEQAAIAIGLTEGPVHIELRLHPSGQLNNKAGPWVIDIAARSIGGLCSRSLQFNENLTLEDVILRHAMNEPIEVNREPKASGVMMIPIPKAGTLEYIDGTLEAKAVPGITDITLSMTKGEKLVPLPDGNKYLGFIFAKADQPEDVEAALRSAHSKLSFQIS
jgi:biotin carboxylase